jgi:ribonuclease R
LVLGQHCSEREQRAAAAERELIKVKLLDYMSQRIGQKMDAVVTGVHDFGLFVQGVELPAEGLIHIRTLQDDYYHYDATTHSLTGSRQRNRYRLGDLLRVEVAHVDVDRRELDFRLVGLLKHPASVKRGPVKKKAKAARKKPAKRARKRPR